MAEPLKNMFNPTFLQRVGAEISAVYPAFKPTSLQRRVLDASWEGLELKQRMRHIAHALRHELPAAYPDAVAVLVAAVERMLARDGERMTFEWMVLPDFVEAFGVDTPEHSLPALEQITRLASAEFAIRPFLLHHPERTYAQMYAWARHSSPLVRRLATEGFRPRLPWGLGVPVLKKDPSPILPVLEQLRHDPAETVRRSVANNLNDISKDHPALVLDLAGKWLGESPEVDWIVRHACRGLLKKGDATALAHFGFEKGAAGLAVEALHCQPSVHIGGVLLFDFVVKNTGTQPVSTRLEYAIDYLTGSGKISRKVFKIKELELASGSQAAVEKYQRFQDFTTRKHYAGPHRLAILGNGTELAARDFVVTD